MKPSIRVSGTGCSDEVALGHIVPTVGRYGVLRDAVARRVHVAEEDLGRPLACAFAQGAAPQVTCACWFSSLLTALKKVRKMFVATFTLHVSDSTAGISLLRPDNGAVCQPFLFLLQGVPAELAYREGIEAGVPAAHRALHVPDEDNRVFDWFWRLPESV